MSISIINNYELNASIFLDSRRSIASLNDLKRISQAQDILYPHGFEVFCVQEGSYYVNVSPQGEVPEWKLRLINDEELSFVSTYSSQKISELLQNASGDDTNIGINDSEPSPVRVYSSQKVESIFAELRQETTRVDDDLLDIDTRVEYLEGEMWKLYGFDGSYDSLTNKPSLENYATKEYVDEKTAGCPQISNIMIIDSANSKQCIDFTSETQTKHYNLYDYDNFDSHDFSTLMNPTIEVTLENGDVLSTPLTPNAEYDRLGGMSGGYGFTVCWDHVDGNGNTVTDYDTLRIIVTKFDSTTYQIAYHKTTSVKFNAIVVHQLMNGALIDKIDYSQITNSPLRILTGKINFLDYARQNSDTEVYILAGEDTSYSYGYFDPDYYKNYVYYVSETSVMTCYGMNFERDESYIRLANYVYIYERVSAGYTDELGDFRYFRYKDMCSYEDFVSRGYIQAINEYYPTEDFNLTTKKYVDDAVGNISTGSDIDTNDLVVTNSISMGRKEGTTIGEKSVAVGYDVEASGLYSHAEGMYTIASGEASHAEGYNTMASNYDSHAEGCGTEASGEVSHAEGDGTIASGDISHAEGCGAEASGFTSHAEGYGTIASSEYQHVQGKYNIEDSANTYAHIVGNGTDDERSNAYTLDWDGNGWFAGEVYGTNLPYDTRKIEEIASSSDFDTTTTGIATISAVYTSDYGRVSDTTFVKVSNDIPASLKNPKKILSIDYTWFEDDGNDEIYEGPGSTSKLQDTDNENIKRVDNILFVFEDTTMIDTHYNPNSINLSKGIWHLISSRQDITLILYDKNFKIVFISEGELNTVDAKFVPLKPGLVVTGKSYDYEINGTQYTNQVANYGAEVFNDIDENIAIGYYSHAEGSGTIATGKHSHAEGYETCADAEHSHAEGYRTFTTQFAAHAEGAFTKAGMYCHAEGHTCYALGNVSHAEGNCTIAQGRYQHVQGKYNAELGNSYAHIVGNGDENNRSNCHTLDWNGNAWFQGNVSVDGTPTNDNDLVTKKYVDDAVANVQSGGGSGNIDLSDYATKEYVDEAINGVDVTEQLTDYAKTEDIPTKTSELTNDSGFLTEHQDISHLANKSDVPTKVSQLTNDKGYLTEHQSLEGLASETYVDNKVSNLVNSAPETLDTLNELAQALGDDPNFATTVSTQIGKKVDKVEGKSLVDDDEIERLANVNNYDDTEVRGLINAKANPSDIPTKVSQLTNDSGFLTSVPSEYVTDSELNAKGYLTQHQSLEDYAKKSELHSHSNKSVLDNITSDKVAEWDNKSTFSGNYNDLTNKPTIPSTEGLATEEYVNNNKFSGDYNDLTNKPTIPSTEGLATEGYVNNMLSGLRLIQMTQSEYDALEVKDSNTLYIII